MRSTPNPLARRFNLEFFAQLPREPGVYFMRSSKGEILYIGKAKNLRSRLLSYRYARLGTAGDNVVAMLELVRKIDWEILESEEQAIARERELIRAIVPRFNVADAWQEDYLYVGLRASRSRDELHFRLTDREDCAEGYKLHGCFAQRRLTKDAYSAMLRLLWASTTNSARKMMPAALHGRAPAYDYTIRIAGVARWRALISSFLQGRSLRLLSALVEAMLENPHLSPHMRPSLQRDLRVLQRFASVAPPASGRLRSQQELRDSIRASIKPLLESAA